MSKRFTVGYGRVWVVVVVAAAIVALRGRGMVEKCEYRRCEGVVWTTQYHITYESDESFNDSIQAIYEKVDASVSKFKEGSLISSINKGEAVMCDDMLVEMYEEARKVYERSGGAFDPTVSPLMKVWGFAGKGGDLPSDEQIDSIMAFVGMNKTRLADRCIEKDDVRIEFDFSAIAKGAACDEVARMLERNGVKNYLVEIGGEIALKGVNRQGEPWGVLVDYPAEDLGTGEKGMMVLRMDRGGVATSGNYRNFKIVDGEKVVHTMNPVTGRPEKTNLLSVTIVAERCMHADAYATACMVMGVEKSKAMLEGSDELGALLVYSVGADSLAMWKNDKFAMVIAEE